MFKKITKKEVQALEKRLSYHRRLVWDELSPGDREKVWKTAEDYKSFLNASKTERETIFEISRRLTLAGFKEVDHSGSKGRVFQVWKDKVLALAILGKEPLSRGMQIIVSHVDAPRLDLKQHPLYEEADLAFFKTHYYGGIKKYQWLARPLALHGTILTAENKKINLAIGEKEQDPVFSVADLLPHLARKVQMEKKLSEAIEGEKLNILVGSTPIGPIETKERFKLATLRYLHEHYGLIEEDLISAELELVPAEPARDVGLDRGIVGAYGQDDRACVFSALKAAIEVEKPGRTVVILFYDKEEVGSEGNTSARARILEGFLPRLFSLKGETLSPQILDVTLTASRAISADVAGALDPDYPEVHEKRNAPRLGCGLCLTKFTGSGGKIGSSDAHAEYVYWIRRLFNQKGIIWQTGEMGKVDEGGGGTIAKFLAALGLEIVDCGTPVLSMHSPFELVSKADLYMTYKGYKAFLRAS
ncbi:MAG: aminopeptidase [Deltaproteobacteria bacterium RBG_13_43_22]|nr:MAG: aminopeptidase [Deltaproteobacteria bacterium RBG_13_43_22]